jgi:hypothetical protein
MQGWSYRLTGVKIRIPSSQYEVCGQSHDASGVAGAS